MHHRGSSRGSSANSTPTRGRRSAPASPLHTAEFTPSLHWDKHLPVPKIGFEACCALVFSVAVLCFINSYDADFVFDDAEAIFNNKDLEPETPVTDLFVHDFWGSKLASNTSHKSYRPLTVLTFRWNHWLAGGRHPRGFHAWNIALHGAVCALLLRVVSTCLSGRLRGFALPRASLLCALMFAVHPIHTESVSGVVGRADLLCALSVFLSFLFYVRSCQIDRDHVYRPSSVSLSWLALSMLLCAISVLFKEQGITVLGLCSAFDIIIQNRVDLLHIVGLRSVAQAIVKPPGLDNNSNKRHAQSRSPSHSNHSTPTRSSVQTAQASTGWVKALFFRHVVLLVTGVLVLSARFSVMGSAPPTFQVVDNPHSFLNSTLLRVLNYNYLYSMNVWLLLYPRWLCFDWSMGCVPVIASLLDVRLVAVATLWVFLGGAVFAGLVKQQSTQTQILQISLAFLVVPFLPASNLFFRVGFVVAERILYLPSVGFCMTVVLGAACVASRFREHKRILQMVFCFVLALYMGRSVQRSNEWRNEFSLFESGAAVCPLNAKVHYNIAKINADTGRNIEYAITKYRLAISLHPEYDQAMNNLANILKERGELTEAEGLLNNATRIRPDFAAAWMNLGIVQAAKHKFSEAEASYLTALRHRRRYPDCLYNLGNLYLDVNRHQEALVAWRNATLQKPTHASAWVNMIILLDSRGKVEEVELAGAEALKHLPNHAAIYYNVGNALCKVGRYVDCEKYFKAAIDLESNNAMYHSNLGVLYHRWGRNAEAQEAYSRAIQLDPAASSARENLLKLQKKMGK